MSTQTIDYKDTGYFSEIICDYLATDTALDPFYGNFPDMKGFKAQLALKEASFTQENRNTLFTALDFQYAGIKKSDLTGQNISLLHDEKTFTITTGHQLNIFTGPLYFLYKIVSVINLTAQLKKEFPNYNFVPVYWMATEDHDFEEINYFKLKGKKVQWNRASSGAVGHLKTSGFEAVFEQFSTLIGTSKKANELKDLFKKSYLEHDTLTAASRYLVNEIFGEKGLVIVDGDDVLLKAVLSPYVKEDLFKNTSFNEVSKSIQELTNLGKNYKIQVNPREINLFYLKEGIRERIIEKDNQFIINNTDIVFSKEAILVELEKHPERFSPNVIMRPLFQELILPNLCYVGGAGEIAYWFELKRYFDSVQVPFPILLLRNSALLINKKQLEKSKKLGLDLVDLFKNQQQLIIDKVKEKSTIKIDFSAQRAVLRAQFEGLKKLALQTDKSFLGAVNAQEKKQLNGLDVLEKRLLKAQKRTLYDMVSRIQLLQDELFPNNSLEERSRNFSEYYEQYGTELYALLFAALDPLKLKFTIVEMPA
ncbi:MAG: bacillithiol biosynthesis cysteine-adding enzyme BshC [Flavobacteriaceae bacterium]|nr:MAG: bacillithiol biosynthesis cysteine-adding enzyme BshC [Flavobacteriaceae bacterium]